jgi:hypothetical protein
VVGAWADAGQQLGDQTPASGDPLPQRPVPVRVVHAEAGAKHRHRQPFGVQRRSVRRLVDASRESRDHDNAVPSKQPGEVRCSPLPIQAWLPGPDHRDRRPVRQATLAG